uniref:SMP-30/Gluconolactonase/LRE-like region domain-containing protein n=1 Tax=Branchiostoma floridae TaxID=7739 RepID=C3Y4B0_BRAFL|eukprot:XP_002609126.1 hypothetical protein BRAFLDRAFT_126146 [Branchiostoma floridae]
MADVGDNIPPEDADQGVVLDGEAAVETPKDEAVPTEATEPQTVPTDPPVKQQEEDLPTPTNGESVGQELPVIHENNDSLPQAPTVSDSGLSPETDKNTSPDTTTPQPADTSGEKTNNETPVTSTPDIHQPADSSSTGLIASGDSKPDQAPPAAVSNDTAAANTKTPEITTKNQAPDILNLSTDGRKSSLGDILDTSDSLKVSGLADGEEDEGVDPGVSGRARLMLEFGGKGDDDGHFMAPAGVQVTKDGDFVVADSDSRRLQVFDSSGKFKYKIKTSMYPRNVAITQDNIFIVSGNLHGEGKVQMLTPTGSFLGEFGTAGQFEYAYGLVVDKNGRIVVTDVHKHRVSIHLPDGRLIHQFGVFGNEDHHFNKPYNVAINAKNNILVSDKHNQCVKMFDSRGTFIKKVGRDGTKDNNLVFPYGLCVDATDDIIVADSTPHPVKLFDCEGKFREYLIISDEPQQGPRALCITPEGRLVVSERDKQVVRVYSLS